MTDHKSAFQRGLRQGMIASLFMGGLVVVGLPMYEYSAAQAWTSLLATVAVTFVVVAGLGAAGIIGPREQTRSRRSNPWVVGLAAIGILALIVTECSGF